jgi:glycosyltransferase involved in cell wall biosynthesis
MSSPKVSVIVPTWNRASLLGAAIESVLAQTFRDLEVVIVDDGSVDATESLVRGFQETDARVRYVAQKHRGISAAMNTGIRESRGQYIARIDSDDQWLPELLETEVAVLEARPDIGLVYAKGQWATSDLTPLHDTIGHAPHFPPAMKDATLRSMLWGDPTCNITVVVRRECFERVGLFDESLAASEDWDMWLRTAVCYRFFFVDRVLSLVRGHDAGTTNAQSQSFAPFLGLRGQVLDKFFARDDLAPEIAAMKTIAYRNLYVFEGNMWIGAGNWRRALEAFWRALRANGGSAGTLARIVWFSLAARALARPATGQRLMQWDSARRLHNRVGNSLNNE